MMSLWDALRMNMMISYQELVRTFPNSRFRNRDHPPEGRGLAAPSPHPALQLPADEQSQAQQGGDKAADARPAEGVPEQAA